MFLKTKEQTGGSRNGLRLLFVLVLTVAALVLSRPPDAAYAANGVEAKVDDVTGKLTFKLTAAKASSETTPHWQTIGFYVTRKPTGQKGVDGTKATDCVFFSANSGWRKDKDNRDGTIETTFTIPRENFIDLCDKAKVDYESLTNNGGCVYLQGVLQGYRPSNGKALTERCYTLAQMQNTRKRRTVNGSTWTSIGWSSTCDSGWKKRYDIKVSYPAVESPVTINYYQSQSGKWQLVASYTNCNAGRIEKKDSGANFTRNLNTSSTGYQWRDTAAGNGSIAGGNGLGLKGNGTKGAGGSVTYDGLYYYNGKPIATSARCLPTTLDKVLPTDSPLTKGDLSQYYLYSSKVSKVDAAKTGGVRNKAGGTSYVRYSGKFVDKNGNLTEAYKEYLPKIRQDFKVLRGGTVINVFYKKQSKPKDPEESEDTISGSYLEPASARAVIQSEARGMEQYDSVSGIPSSEEQYVNVFTDEYLYEYKFRRIKGESTFSQYISCSHSYTDEETGQTHYLHDHDTKAVTRSYSYWVVDTFCVYELTECIVSNYSLPGGRHTLTPQGGYHAPYLFHFSAGGILSEPEDGWEVKEYIVCNDTLIFGSTEIMSSMPCEKETAAPKAIPKPGQIGKDVLYRHPLEIGAYKENGTYESDATITYARMHNSVGAGDAELEIPVTDINDVTILTPAICYPSLTDAREYTQLVTPGTDCYYLVLDRYFTVHMPTCGYHSDLKGYGTRDYAKFIKARQASFPFDVYMVSAGSYTYYKAGTWITLTADDTRFYLPIWVDETAAVGMDFRSLAINCMTPAQEACTQPVMNSSVENYVAEDTKYTEVSGRMYGLNIYDISDYPLWQGIFREPDSLKLLGTKYAVGVNDENGMRKDRAHILPLVNGSHPLCMNAGVSKTGYTSRFKLTTIGNIYHGTDYIRIVPRFYYVSYDGTGMQEVDLYYNESIGGQYQTVVKAGGSLDKKNVKSMTLGSPYTSVPEQEIRDKAAVAGLTEADIRSAACGVYTYGEITIPSRMSTYVGKNYAPNGVIPADVDADKVTKSMQSWYFEYSLPSDVHAVAKGFDVTAYAREHYGIDYSEDIWKKDGYILVNFDITTYQSGFEKFENGTLTGLGSIEGEDIFEEINETPLAHLNYTNRDNVPYGFCNMWKMEGQVLTRRDYSGATFHFRYGDVLLYWLDRSATQDYLSYGTH